MVKIEEIEDRPWEKLNLCKIGTRGVIPTIIHQLVSHKNLTKTQEQNQLTWQRLHPDWCPMLWTQTDVEDYIELYHPDFTSTFKGLYMGVQRLEVFRYFVLHDYGGICTDMNFVPKTSLDEYVVQGGDLLIAFNARTRSFSNSLMASVPGHELWKMIWKELLHPSAPEWVTRGDFLNSSFKSGQAMLNKVLSNYSKVLSIFPLSTLDQGPRMQPMRTQFRASQRSQSIIQAIEPYRELLWILFFSVLMITATIYGRGVSKRLTR
jgi:mannosyltransferase OCH1-like enzyme